MGSGTFRSHVAILRIETNHPYDRFRVAVVGANRPADGHPPLLRRRGQVTAAEVAESRRSPSAPPAETSTLWSWPGCPCTRCAAEAAAGVSWRRPHRFAGSTASEAGTLFLTAGLASATTPAGREGSSARVPERARCRPPVSARSTASAPSCAIAKTAWSIHAVDQPSVDPGGWSRCEWHDSGTSAVSVRLGRVVRVAGRGELGARKA